MPVGKESIKRAASAGRKKTAAKAAPESKAKETEVKAAVIANAEPVVTETSGVEKKDKGIIQAFEELPVWLL